MKTTFGPKFFFSQEENIQIHDQNWLHQLLVNTKQKGSFLLLLDYAKLIDYATSLGTEFFHRIKQLETNLDNLRSYFFELFTYRLLDNNGIENVKRTIEGNQEQEGRCNIAGSDFLFECRKLYLPGSIELDVKKYIATHLVMKIKQEFNVGIGVLITVRFKRVVSNKSKAIFREKIDRFFRKLEIQKGRFHSIDYEDQDDNGVFKVSDYSIDQRLELENDKGCDVFCYLAPPGIITPGVPNHFVFHVSTSFTKDNSQVTDYLLNKIKEKKRQHNTSNFTKQIFFFDNEAFPGVRMSLFPMAKSNFEINEKIVQTYIDESSSDVILCIINRNYTHSKPIIEIKTFCKPHLNNIKATLQHLISNRFL